MDDEESGSPETSMVALEGAEQDIVPAQSLQPVSDEQVQNQCMITGGDFPSAHFGSQTYNLTRQEGVIQDFQGAHFGPRTINQNFYFGRSVSEDTPTTSARRSSEETQPKSLPATPSEVPPGRDAVQLSDNIWMFRDNKLSGNVYRGVLTSGVYGSQPIAVKFIQFDERNVEEAKSLRKLKPHKHVVCLIHADLSDQGPVKFMFIAMEICHPKNLHDHISSKDDPTFDSAQGLLWAEQLVQGMHHIHINKIIHRDLKPHNLLLSVDRRFIKIADFGLSKEMKSGRSVTAQSHLRIGTDGYRAPETYNSDVISQQADIFSLGLVVYFMWSDGGHPYGDEPDLWNYNIKSNKDHDLRELKVANIAAAEGLITWMLQFEPKDRPTTDLLLHDISSVTGAPAVPSPRASPVAERGTSPTDSMEDPSLGSTVDLSSAFQEQLHGANGNIRVAWEGDIGWEEAVAEPSTSSALRQHEFRCKVLLSGQQADSWINARQWPPNLRMSLFPHAVFRSLGEAMRNGPRVDLQISPPDQKELLASVMAKKWFGLVHVKSAAASLNIIMLIILYQKTGKFFGLFPVDPDSFVTSLVAAEGVHLSGSKQGPTTSRNMEQGGEGTG